MIGFLYFLLIFATVPQQPELEKAVTAYWNFLVQGEKSSALRFVLPEAHNNFIMRREPPFRAWKLVGSQPKSHNEAIVTVEVERMMMGGAGFYWQKVEETWIFDSQQWKIRIELPADPLRKLYNPPPESQEEKRPAELQVVPEWVEINFLEQLQRGTFLVRNGLDSPVDEVHLELDQEKFAIVDKPEYIKPNADGLITIEYKGNEIAKELRSQVRLTVKQAGQEKVFNIPILYNHLTPGARGLFGLTEEAAQKLTRQEIKNLRPLLKRPVQ